MSCKLFEKRGQWCFRDKNNKLHKFPTKEEAEKALTPQEKKMTAYEMKQAMVDDAEEDE